MLLTIIICALTILVMVGTVLFKPYINIKGHAIGLYWIVCLIGAILLIACGCISFGAVIQGVTANSSVNPLKILTLFLSMTLLSVYLGDAGFFDAVADKLFSITRGSQLKLFLGLYIVVAILTIFTSNDIIVLTFTPAICIFAKKAKISPLPYLVGEFIGANTWSMMLIVGNPTNIYLAQSAGITFNQYFATMVVPTICGGIVSLLVLLLIFRKQLKTPLPDSRIPDIEHAKKMTPKVKIEKITMIVAIVHLLTCIVLLSLSDLIGVEMWLVCFISALSLSLFDIIYDAIRYKTVRPVLRSLKKEPYELIPFVLSMFVIVLALNSCGATKIISNLLITNTKADSVILGFTSAISANLLNNIPMSVLFEGIVANGGFGAVLGAVVGSNIGAYITPVGALAGIMWNKILTVHGVKLPFKNFLFYGIVVAIPTLIATLVPLCFLA